jgi:hypothetical protein
VQARAGYCWNRAAFYGRRAREATDADVRGFFARLEESWIRAANRFDLDRAAGLDVAPAAAPAERACERRLPDTRPEPAGSA